MSSWIALPLIVPLAAAIVNLLIRSRPAWQRSISLFASTVSLVLSVWLLNVVDAGHMLVLHIGNWPAPFGITLVLDRFSAVMLTLSGLMGTAVSIYGRTVIDEARERHGYHVLYNVLLMGVNGAFLTGDLFNLYVWFEVMLMASFVLLVLGGERAQLEGGIKYVAINFFSSAIFLAAVGILYGMTGTLNMADLAVKLANTPHDGLITTVGMLFLIAFGIKAAAFPLFFWLPASYHTPPSPVSAIFAGLLTKVGVYSMIRVFTLIFTQEVAFTHTIILWMGAATMITGVLGAAAQMDMRRILSFHIISQIGYMIMGLGLFTELALAGAIFYIFHHIIVKTNLFLVAGVILKSTGTNELKKLGDVIHRAPWLAVLFLVPALSLAGLPPLSGFFAKLTLITASFKNAEYAIAAIALIVGLLTLFSMTKIWQEVFWKPAPPDGAGWVSLPARTQALMYGPIIALAVCTIFIGLNAGRALDFSMRAAEQLMHRETYIQAVLGGATR